MRRAAYVLVLALGCSDPGPPASSAASPPSSAPPSTYACDPHTGLAEPMRACSERAPCTTLLVTERDRGTLTTGSDVPTCRAPSSRGGFVDGAPRSRVDADGNTRYACAFVPREASAASPVPLVVFFHAPGGSADDVYAHTSLRRKAASYVVGDGPAGFALLSIQARNLHWPTPDPRDGPQHDVHHRDLRSPSTSPDIANADAFVDEAVATGIVDRSRIYVVGWSTGGLFAQIYGIARFDTATPGGHHVAAAAVFGAADPFVSPRAVDAGRCDSTPPHTALPIAFVSRGCDLVPCDEAQVTAFRAAGQPMQPGGAMRTWTTRLARELGDPNAAWRIVNAFGDEVSECTYPPMCPTHAALTDHVRWPDGVADQSSIDHEPFMLDFLRTHPRAAP